MRVLVDRAPLISALTTVACAKASPADPEVLHHVSVSVLPGGALKVRRMGGQVHAVSVVPASIEDDRGDMNILIAPDRLLEIAKACDGEISLACDGASLRIESSLGRSDLRVPRGESWVLPERPAAGNLLWQASAAPVALSEAARRVSHVYNQDGDAATPGGVFLIADQGGLSLVTVASGRLSWRPTEGSSEGSSSVLLPVIAPIIGLPGGRDSEAKIAVGQRSVSIAIDESEISLSIKETRLDAQRLAAVASAPQGSERVDVEMTASTLLRHLSMVMAGRRSDGAQSATRLSIFIRKAEIELSRRDGGEEALSVAEIPRRKGGEVSTAVNGEWMVQSLKSLGDEAITLWIGEESRGLLIETASGAKERLSGVSK